MMNKLRPTCLAFCLAIFLISSFSTQAHADQTLDNYKACRIAINSYMGFETGVSGELYYKLKKIRKHQVQKLTFKARTDVGKSTIICTVRRSIVLELTDGDKRPLK